MVALLYVYRCLCLLCIIDESRGSTFRRPKYAHNSCLRANVGLLFLEAVINNFRCICVVQKRRATREVLIYPAYLTKWIFLGVLDILHRTALQILSVLILFWVFKSQRTSPSN